MVQMPEYRIVITMIASKEGGGKREEVKGEYRGIWGVEEGNADYGGVVQPSQQHVTVIYDK